MYMLSNYGADAWVENILIFLEIFLYFNSLRFNFTLAETLRSWMVAESFILNVYVSIRSSKPKFRKTSQTSSLLLEASI